MTTTVRQHTGNGYHVSLDVELTNTGSLYVVEACPMIDEHLCGYPERKMTYPIYEEKKALATYKRYVKKYCTL